MQLMFSLLAVITSLISCSWTIQAQASRPLGVHVLSVNEVLHLPGLWLSITNQDDYETVPYPKNDNSSLGFIHFSQTSQVKSTGRTYTVYVGSLSSGLPDRFSFELPNEGCCHRSKTSSTAQLHNCLYATNAGFFNTKNGCCVGNLITNNKTIQVPGTSRVNFGLRTDGYVIGYMANTTIQHQDFHQLIQGVGWLVRNGKSHVNESKSIEAMPTVFVTEKAPRTAVMVSSNGTLSLVQVDGVEHNEEGLDLYEFAEVLIGLGAWQAANLDGGGSSVSVYKGSVIDKPTCTDTTVVCEREDTSITCIHNIV